MARERPPEKREDVPTWFMTYSDVITLLMTFFILLLTFSTNEPEVFERIQVTMFGGSGATGIAGKRADGLERDSFVARLRPPVARMVMRGAEMPPMEDDPARSALSSGLKGLDEDEQRDPATGHSIEVPLPMLVADGHVTSVGQQQLGMLARQLQSMGMHVSLQVAGPEQLDALMGIVQYLVRQSGVPPGKIGTSIAAVTPEYVRIIMTRHVAD